MTALWKVDGSNRNDSATQELHVPNTAKIQQALAPKVTDIKWVNSGADRATVIVKGSNFFSGTQVMIGGDVRREEDGTLTLKSDRALEFETTVTSLATGDSVLSGRFGSSFQLTVPAKRRPVQSLYIARAMIRPSRYTKAFRIRIDVKGLDNKGGELDRNHRPSGSGIPNYGRRYFASAAVHRESSSLAARSRHPKLCFPRTIETANEADRN